MTKQTLGHSKRRRRLRLFTVVSLAALVPMLFSISSSAGPVGDASGFEDDDGNLAVNSTFDWNGFAPVTWTGTAPTRTSSKTVSGWDFTGLEDWQATTADSAFAGGTKQDDECATVNTGKAPNKDDLKRVYFSSKTVSGDVFLNLAWVRIPQNTTSPSAHIGFEFNQSETLCPAGSDGLVTRTAGDMLIVYDFEGGSTDTPTITLGRWLTDPSDPDQADFFTDPDSPCEVDSNSPPCWGDFVDLTDLGFAEGRVNTTTVGTVTDALTPPTPPATTSVSSTLGLNEFGEAGINLTDAGVFQPNECLAFGKSYAVSRSSGNSGTAQMKDLVGPGDVDLANCGRVIIRKVTDPSPDPTDTTFTYATTGGLVPPTFGLKNGEFFDYGPEVIAGAYSVTEDDPSADNFVLTDIDCSASETANGTTITENEGTRTVSFNLAAEDTVDCTFTNTLQTGAIEITKTRKHAATPDNDAHAGVEFTVDGTTVTTDANGEACVDGLVFGTYTVTESVPAGYVSDDPSKDVLVDNTATCEDDPYGGETVSFHNTPLTNVTVSVNSQIDGGTASTIVCTDADANESSASTGANGDGSLTVNDLLPTDPTVTLTCEITVDP